MNALSILYFEDLLFDLMLVKLIYPFYLHFLRIVEDWAFQNHWFLKLFLDAHNLDVRTAAEQGAEEVAAYSTESIDTDLDGHTVSSYCGDGRAGW